jgi:DUF1680 family protein
MDGEKKASAHEIVFQARPGGPELNCCSVNAPRGIGLLTEWAVLRAPDGIVLNYYGPGSVAIPTSSGQKLKVSQQTRYPASGDVQLRIDVAKTETFALYLRIPAWSAKTRVRVNGEPREASAGSYLRLQRTWRTGDTVAIEFDMSPHYWAGERRVEGKASLYYGPLLLAFDPTYNAVELADVPELDAAGLTLTPEKPAGLFPPIVLFKTTAVNGTPLRLCDFASAGAYGNAYRTWLPVRNLRPVAFDGRRPVWANRP